MKREEAMGIMSVLLLYVLSVFEADSLSDHRDFITKKDDEWRHQPLSQVTPEPEAPWARNQC
jgi:hypothetical protein